MREGWASHEPNIRGTLDRVARPNCVTSRFNGATDASRPTIQHPEHPVKSYFPQYTTASRAIAGRLAARPRRFYGAAHPIEPLRQNHDAAPARGSALACSTRPLDSLKWSRSRRLQPWTRQGLHPRPLWRTTARRQAIRQPSRGFAGNGSGWTARSIRRAGGPGVSSIETSPAACARPCPQPGCHWFAPCTVSAVSLSGLRRAPVFLWLQRAYGARLRQVFS